MSQKWAGAFNAGAEAKDGAKLDDVEGSIYGEIEKLQREEVPAEELQKVKNNFAASEYRKLSSNMAILMQLIHTEGSGHWQEINEAAAKYQAVTAADVKRVAKEYFTRENRAVAVYTRKPGSTNKAESN
jgi:predicted Zn-dependent peptidase